MILKKLYEYTDGPHTFMRLTINGEMYMIDVYYCGKDGIKYRTSLDDGPDTRDETITRDMIIKAFNRLF